MTNVIIIIFHENYIQHTYTSVIERQLYLVPYENKHTTNMMMKGVIRNSFQEKVSKMLNFNTI